MTNMKLKTVENHNHGVYFAAYNDRGVLRKKKRQEMLKKGVTTNTTATIDKPHAHFRVFFMSTTLPTEGIRRNENGIINLNNARDQILIGWRMRRRKIGLNISNFCSL